MKATMTVAGFAMLWIYTASPAVASVEQFISVGTYPVRHPIKFAYKCTFPIRHPLKTGKWMEESGFNGGLQGAGAAGQLVFTVSNFLLR